MKKLLLNLLVFMAKDLSALEVSPTLGSTTSYLINFKS